MNRGCCVGRREAATYAFHQGLQMRRRDRRRKPYGEKAFQRRTPQQSSPVLRGARLEHATERWSSFRERNRPDLAVPRREFPNRQTRRFGQISTLAGGQFRVWRGQAPCQIRPRLSCGGKVRSSMIALSSWPGVQARPRFSSPLPGVQETIMSDAELAAVERVAREALPIRPVVRLGTRRRQPPSTERSGNLLSTEHQAVWPQALDRRTGMPCSMLLAAPRGPAHRLRRLRAPALGEREDAPGAR